jgi:hypothetical protein
VQPPANSKPGDKVYFEGSDFECALLSTLILQAPFSPTHLGSGLTTVTAKSEEEDIRDYPAWYVDSDIR